MVRHIPWSRVIDDRPVGPIVNVSFTLDMHAFQLLHSAGKNRSQTVRNAIKYYCSDREPAPELVKKFNEVCTARRDLQIENKILREIINSNLPNVDLEAKIELLVDQVKPKLEDPD